MKINIRDDDDYTFIIIKNLRRIDDFGFNSYLDYNYMDKLTIGDEKL